MGGAQTDYLGLAGNAFLSFYFPCVQNKVACVNTHAALIQLSTDGFHQHRHWRGWACDVGGACVNHSSAALCAKHHLHSHWNTAGREKSATKRNNRMKVPSLLDIFPGIFPGNTRWVTYSRTLTLSWLPPTCPSLWYPYNWSRLCSSPGLCRRAPVLHLESVLGLWKWKIDHQLPRSSMCTCIYSQRFNKGTRDLMSFHFGLVLNPLIYCLCWLKWEKSTIWFLKR